MSDTTSVPPIVDINTISKVPETPAQDDLGLPSIEGLTCGTVDAIIAAVKEKSLTARPTAEGEAKFQAWFDAAQKFKDSCSASGGGAATTASSAIPAKISKNMKPIVTALAIALTAVLLYKLVKD